MTGLRNYVRSRKTLRITLVTAGFAIASVSLFMAVATYLFIQYAALDAAIYLVIALVFDVGIAWLLQHNGRRRFWLNLLFVSVAVMVGAIVASIGFLRQHWASTVKELLKQLFSN
jgi:hypothetical protein